MRTGLASSTEIASETHRLTGGFHLSEDQVAVARMRRWKGPTDALVDLCKPGGLFRGPIFSRMYVEDPAHGVPYVSAKDLVRADVRPAAYLSHKHGDLLDRLRLDEGMILVTCSGMNLGEAIWVREDMDGLCGSHDLIRVCADEQKVPPGYLYAFLRSRYGHALIRRQIYGGNIKHIEPEHLANFRIPRLGSDREDLIAALGAKSFGAMAAYKNGVVTATQQFLEIAGIDEIGRWAWRQQACEGGFEVDGMTQMSLRAITYEPRFLRIIEKIRAGKWRQLGNLVLGGTLTRGARFKRIEADEDFAYQLIGQSQLFRTRPEGRWISRLSMSEDVQVGNGTILVAAQGTLGESELYCRSEFVWGSDTEHHAYSEHLLRVCADENQILKGALYAFMRSDVAFRMLRSMSTGSKLQDHHPILLRSLPVPHLSQADQEVIDDLVVRAYNARELGGVLEGQMCKMVEQAIEEAS